MAVRGASAEEAERKRERASASVANVLTLSRRIVETTREESVSFSLFRFLFVFLNVIPHGLCLFQDNQRSKEIGNASGNHNGKYFCSAA